LKITDAKNIKESEKELIDTITGDLNWDSIEEIIKNKHQIELEDDIEYQKGDIIVHKNEIAYKLDFKIRVSLSVLFNRQGECIDIGTPHSDDSNDGSSGKASNTDLSADDLDLSI